MSRIGGAPSPSTMITTVIRVVAKLGVLMKRKTKIAMKQFQPGLEHTPLLTRQSQRSCSMPRSRILDLPPRKAGSLILDHSLLLKDLKTSTPLR